MARSFNTLQHSLLAEQAGIPREQAEFYSLELNKIVQDMENDYITKKHFDAKMLHLEQSLIMLEQRLMIKLGALMITGITIMGAALGLISFFAKG